MKFSPRVSLFLVMLPGLAWAESHWDQEIPYSLTGRVTAMIKNAQGTIFAGGEQGMFRSTDEGASWRDISAGLSNSNVLGITTVADGSVFVATGTSVSGPHYDIDRSTDNGMSWSVVTPESLMVSSVILSITTLGPSIVLTSGHLTGIRRTDDYGKHWRLLESTMTSRWVHFLTSSKSGTLYAGTDSGVYASRDTGLTWRLILSKLALGTHVTALAAPESAVVLVGAAQQRVFCSFDGGTTWLPPRLDSLGIYSPQAFTVFRDGKIYTAGNGVTISTDSGQTWRSIDSGQADEVSSSTGIVISDSGYLLVGTINGGIWRWSRRQGILDLSIPFFPLHDDDVFYYQWVDRSNGQTGPIYIKRFIGHVFVKGRPYVVQDTIKGFSYGHRIQRRQFYTTANDSAFFLDQGNWDNDSTTSNLPCGIFHKDLRPARIWNLGPFVDTPYTPTWVTQIDTSSGKWLGVPVRLVHMHFDSALTVADWLYADMFGCVEAFTGEPDPNIGYTLVGCVIGGLEYGKLTEVYQSYDKVVPDHPLLIEAFPNPFTESFHLRMHGPVMQRHFTISLTDCLGRRVFVKEDVSVPDFSIGSSIAGNLTPGLYVLDVREGRGEPGSHFFIVKK